MASLSTEEYSVGEILMSLKQDSNAQYDFAQDKQDIKFFRDLTLSMPNTNDYPFYHTVSPVAANAYNRTPPSHSPTTHRAKRYGPVVQLDDLRKCFNMPIAIVARKFGICATLLKKICRRHGIQRWPHRQIRSLQKSIDMLKESLHVAKGSNKEYIAKKITAFEHTLACIMQDPNTAAKGISAGRLASPATEELVKRGNRLKNRRAYSTPLPRTSDHEYHSKHIHDDCKPRMSLQSILC